MSNSLRDRFEDARPSGRLLSPVRKEASAFWSAFSDELVKLAAKNPVSIKVPKIGTNLKGMENLQLNPGKTPVTAPGKANASLASTSGVGHSLPVGRTGTSAQPSPQPFPVT